MSKTSDVGGRPPVASDEVARRFVCSLLIGAIPRQGKTFVARLPLTAAALDPHVRVIIADGKVARTSGRSSRWRTGSSAVPGSPTPGG